MNLQLLNQADAVLNACGGREAVQGGTVVGFERKIIFPMEIPLNATQTFTKQINGEVPFELRAISSDQRTADQLGIRAQIRMPNGRFLFGKNGIDAAMFGGIGSFRPVIDPPEECEPGGNIEVTLSDYLGVGPSVVNLLFEGVDKYYLKGGNQPSPLSALRVPKYQGIINENILAPAYVAGVWPRTPKGAQDSQFTYSSFSDNNTTNLNIPNALAVPVTGPTSGSLNIPIDAGINFVVRRIIADVNQDSTVTGGEFLVRVRSSGGYSLTDGFIDIAQYFSGVEFPVDWVIPGGEQVLIDVVLADGAGTGNMYIQVHLEGVKRRYA